ncbi:MAG: hypothetical protein GWN86_17235 [Desulfobacterales bacterium]|nr:hypothetical protein [Desulfobacterales bacterium]
MNQELFPAPDNEPKQMTMDERITEIAGSYEDGAKEAAKKILKDYGDERVHQHMLEDRCDICNEWAPCICRWCHKKGKEEYSTAEVDMLKDTLRAVRNDAGFQAHFPELVELIDSAL